jgi:hypothetical protein
VVTKWLLEVPNVPPATLEIKHRVNQKSPVSCSAFGFIIFDAPHFRNPYLTKVTNQLGSTFRRSRHLFDISRTFEITASVFHHYFKCLNLYFCQDQTECTLAFKTFAYTCFSLKKKKWEQEGTVSRRPIVIFLIAVNVIFNLISKLPVHTA